MRASQAKPGITLTFRLTHEARALLDQLAAKNEMSRVTVVELAIRHLAMLDKVVLPAEDADDRGVRPVREDSPS
jgi:predicted transcriptional regulator